MLTEAKANAIFQISPFYVNGAFEETYLNESLINEALANITIAAISVDLWQDFVKGNVSRVYSVYRFDRRLNFFLPYGLCLSLTIPIVALGLLALRHNGVSAKDGGFVQILMTAATGDTAIEQAAKSGFMGGAENIPEGLKRLKVRFGELIPTDMATPGESESRKAEREAGMEHPRDRDTGGSVDEAAAVSLLQDHDAVESREAESSQVTTASGVATYETKSVVTRRAGFGTLEETVPLRGKRDLSQT